MMLDENTLSISGTTNKKRYLTVKNEEIEYSKCILDDSRIEDGFITVYILTFPKDQMIYKNTIVSLF